MSYQKLQVGLASIVVKSDTIDIPLESSQQLTGETTATTANKLVNSGETFQDYQNLIVGATVVLIIVEGRIDENLITREGSTLRPPVYTPQVCDATLVCHPLHV